MTTPASTGGWAHQSSSPDRLVVVPIIDGYADTRVVHLPAYERGCGGHGQIVIRFCDLKWAPRTWPSLCGVVEAGAVYNHGGLLEAIPICGACLAVSA